MCTYHLGNIFASSFSFCRYSFYFLLPMELFEKFEVMKKKIHLKEDLPHFTTKESIQWELLWFYDIDPTVLKVQILNCVKPMIRRAL